MFMVHFKTSMNFKKEFRSHIFKQSDTRPFFFTSVRTETVLSSAPIMLKSVNEVSRKMKNVSPSLKI